MTVVWHINRTPGCPDDEWHAVEGERLLCGAMANLLYFETCCGDENGPWATSADPFSVCGTCLTILEAKARDDLR